MHRPVSRGLETEKAGWTHGFDLPARFVIHTPGPNYRAGQTDRALLESSYRNCLAVADELGIDSIAFPLISAGAYGWPEKDAINAAVDVLSATPTRVSQISIVALDATAQEAIQHRLARVTWLRILQGVGVLHQRGYEGVRIYPGFNSSGTSWRVMIASEEHFEPVWDGTDFVPASDVPGLRYSTAAGTGFGEGNVTVATTPDEVADMILEEVPTFAREYSDREYAVWFQALLAVSTALESTPYAYSDYFDADGWLLTGSDIVFPFPPSPLHLRS